MPHNHLNKLAQDAIDRELKRRSVLHAEAAIFSLMDAYGTKEAVRILREMAQHLEDHG